MNLFLMFLSFSICCHTTESVTRCYPELPNREIYLSTFLPNLSFSSQSLLAHRNPSNFHALSPIEPNRVSSDYETRSRCDFQSFLLIPFDTVHTCLQYLRFLYVFLFSKSIVVHLVSLFSVSTDARLFFCVLALSS